MVVLEEHPSLTTRIRVAGELATEYDPPDDHDLHDTVNTRQALLPTKHCFIESKLGAEFRVELTATSDFIFPDDHDLLSVSVHIDGTWMRTKLIRKSNISQGSFLLIVSNTWCPLTADNEPPVLKDYVFAPITRIDDPNAQKISSDIKRAKHMGNIRVAISTGKDSGRAPWVWPQKPLNQELDLAEKAMKGRELSHATSLVISTEKESSIHEAIRFRKKRRLGNILFHYRSHEGLQHEMIIPRSPSPEPESPARLSEDGLSHLSESEIRRLAWERLRENQIKHESPGVKREADQASLTPRPWKIVKLEDGKQVVDLTDD